MKYILTILLLSSLFANGQNKQFDINKLSAGYDIVRPGAGANFWFNNNDLRRKVMPNEWSIDFNTTDSTTSTVADYYVRVNWGQIEAAGSGTTPAASNRFDWSALDFYFKAAIDQGAKLSFGILTISTGYAPYGTVGGAALGYPTWLHNVMQAEALSANRDYIGASTWVPNWNHASYLAAIDTLTKDAARWINATSYTPATGPKAGQSISYASVLNRVDIRGYGNFGEWNLADIGAGSGNQNVTKASLQAIVNTHKNAFPNYQLQMLMEALTIQPSGAASGEFNYWILTQSNNYGKFGYRMDNWGQDIFNEYVVCNGYSYNPGGGVKTIQSMIDTLYRYAPVDGEPSNFGLAVYVPADLESYYGYWCGTCDSLSKSSALCTVNYPGGSTLTYYGALARQVRQRHATSFGNGNFEFSGTYATGRHKDSILTAWRQAGARIEVISGQMQTTLTQGQAFTVKLRIKNTGYAPVYESFNTELELRTSGNTLLQTFTVPFTVRGFQPGSDSTVTVTLNLGSVTVGSGNKLNIIMKDPNGYRKPYPLAMRAPAQNTDGSYTLRNDITIQSSSVVPLTVRANVRRLR